MHKHVCMVTENIMSNLHCFWSKLNYISSKKKFGQNPLKDVDSRVFTRMLQKDGRYRYYIPLQLRWQGDKKESGLNYLYGLKHHFFVKWCDHPSAFPCEVNVNPHIEPGELYRALSSCTLYIIYVITVTQKLS